MGVSRFRGSNLTKTMANLQDLESLEPLNPLTPDPDFGNLFCGKFISEVWLLGNSTLEGFESVSLPLL